MRSSRDLGLDLAICTLQRALGPSCRYDERRRRSVAKIYLREATRRDSDYGEIRFKIRHRSDGSIREEYFVIIVAIARTILFISESRRDNSRV